MNNPCRDCQSRKLGCHSGCECYAAWKVEHEKIMQRKRELNADYDLFQRTLMRMKRKVNRK